MKVKYEYDQDPRYGWASIDLEDNGLGTIIIRDGSKTHGFEYSDGEMKPICICNAWHSFECACENVDWGD